MPPEEHLTKERLANSSKSVATLSQNVATVPSRNGALKLKSGAFKQDKTPTGPFSGMGPKSKIGRQETVTGNASVGFGNEMVIVHNKGPVQPTLGFNGGDISYPSGEFVTVPAEVAFHHFGVIALGERFERPKNAGSQYEDRLSGYAPLALWQRDPEGYQAFIDWFDTGLEFKVFRPATHVQSTDWERIRSTAIY